MICLHMKGIFSCFDFITARGWKLSDKSIFTNVSFFDTRWCVLGCRSGWGLSSRGLFLLARHPGCRPVSLFVWCPVNSAITPHAADEQLREQALSWCEQLTHHVLGTDYRLKIGIPLIVWYQINCHRLLRGCFFLPDSRPLYPL